MIPKENLVPGEWYDGFIWDSGKQRGVATMCWHTVPEWSNGYFFPKEGPHLQYGYHHPEDGYPKVQTFEPNMRGINPHLDVDGEEYEE